MQYSTEKYTQVTTKYIHNMHNHCPVICTGKKQESKQGKEQVGKFNLVSQDKVFPIVVCHVMNANAQVMVIGRCGILLLCSSNASPNLYNPFRISIL